jgi:hypothetical protein
MENPDSWRLIDIRAENEAVVEEAVFTVQGILIAKAKVSREHHQTGSNLQ